MPNGTHNYSKDVGFLACDLVCVSLCAFVSLLLQTLYVSHPITLTCGNLRHSATVASIVLPGTVHSFSLGFTNFQEFIPVILEVTKITRMNDDLSCQSLVLVLIFFICLYPCLLSLYVFQSASFSCLMLVHLPLVRSPRIPVQPCC